MFLFLTLRTAQMFQNISVLKWPLAHFHFNAFFSLPLISYSHLLLSVPWLPDKAMRGHLSDSPGLDSSVHHSSSSPREKTEALKLAGFTGLLRSSYSKSKCEQFLRGVRERGSNKSMLMYSSIGLKSN